MNRLPKSRNGRIAFGLIALAVASCVCWNSIGGGDKAPEPTSAPQPLLLEATAAPRVETAAPVPTDTEEPTEIPTDEPSVAAPTETPAPTPVPVQATAVPVVQPTEAPPPPPAQADGCVNFNTASFDDLRRIINVDDDIARQILDLRAKRPFSGWDDLVDRVKGIGENNVKEIQAQGLGCF